MSSSIHVCSRLQNRTRKETNQTQIAEFNNSHPAQDPSMFRRGQRPALGAATPSSAAAWSFLAWGLARRSSPSPARTRANSRRPIWPSRPPWKLIDGGMQGVEIGPCSGAVWTRGRVLPAAAAACASDGGGYPRGRARKGKREHEMQSREEEERFRVVRSIWRDRAEWHKQRICHSRSEWVPAPQINQTQEWALGTERTRAVPLGDKNQTHRIGRAHV